MTVAPELFLVNSAMARLHLYRGDRDRALDFAQFAVTINPKAAFGLAILARGDLEEGRAVNAKVRYETGFPELAGTEPVINALNYQAAVDFALVLSELGEADRAEQLRSRCLAYIGGIPRLGFRGFWVMDARIHAQRGEIQLALSALDEAVDAGWRVYGWYYFDFDPSFETLRAESGFQAARDRWLADMNRQHARVEANSPSRTP